MRVKFDRAYTTLTMKAVGHQGGCIACAGTLRPGSGVLLPNLSHGRLRLDLSKPPPELHVCYFASALLGNTTLWPTSPWVSHRVTFSRTLRILRVACVISSSLNPAKPSKRPHRGGLAV
jgi:hypothetical protein